MKSRAQLAKQAEKDSSLRLLEMLEQECLIKNELAIREIEVFRNVLSRSLAVIPKFTWKNVYGRRQFGKCVLPAKPTYEDVAERLGVRKKDELLEMFSRATVTERKAQERSAWQMLEKEIGEWEDQCNKSRALHEAKKKEYFEKQAAWNSDVDIMRARLKERHPDAVQFYLKALFASLPLQAVIDESIAELSLENETGILGINVKLPNPESMPKVSKYRFVKARKEIVPVLFKQKDRDALFEGLVFQAALSYISTVFRVSEANFVTGVVFNG